MRTILLSLLVLIVASKTLPAPVESQSCQEIVLAFATKLSDNNKLNQDQKLSYLL